MRPRHVGALLATALLSAGSAFADPPRTVYVTNGLGRQILAITIDPATGIQDGAAQVVAQADSMLTDLTLRSDGVVFYATDREIRRVGQETPVAAISHAFELRFSAFNCLFYNRVGGVNSVGCGNASPAGTGGRGLAFDLFGRLLGISGSTVVRIPVDALGNKGTPTTIVSSGLTSPTGIAVAGGEGSNQLQRGDFIVTDGRFVRLYDGKTAALKNAEYASVPVGQTINFADFDADDRLWLAVMTTSSGSRTPNGRVYHADAGGAACADSGGVNCTLAAVLPTVSDKYPPAIGLALAPSGRLLTRAIEPVVPHVEQAFTFDFGASIVEIDALVIESCELRVSARTAFTGDATALIADGPYSLNPYLGDEGYPTIYHIESRKNGQVVPAEACVDVSPADRPSVYIAALTSTEVNPQVLRCEESCNAIELFGWWHTGPIENDAEGGGKTDDWSEWLIVEGPAAPPQTQIDFCGVTHPFRMDRLTVFDVGSTIPVKAAFSTPGGNCEDEIYLTDPNARFLISLAQVSPTRSRKRLVGESGPPIMTLGDKTYDFVLSLNESNGQPYAEGLYELTLTDVTPGGARLSRPVTIYFQIVDLP